MPRPASEVHAPYARGRGSAAQGRRHARQRGRRARRAPGRARSRRARPHQRGEPEVDRGLERVVALGFRERLAVQRHGVSRARARTHVGELARGRSPARRPARPRLALVEQGERAAGVAGGVVPVGGEEEPATRASASADGVSRSACSASSAAAAGAPRACADRAASSRIAATSRLGSAVASARCRARSSASARRVASRA